LIIEDDVPAYNKDFPTRGTPRHGYAKPSGILQHERCVDPLAGFVGLRPGDIGFLPVESRIYPKGNRRSDREKTGFDFGDILDLIPIERGHSARLVKLKIVGSKKIFTIGKDLEIRRTLSPSHLYSSAIIVDKLDIVNGVPQKFVLTGAGWGHGVGLCQIGAAVMGAQGYTYERILMHYFRGAEILKIY
jgi:peptidoglycan hydrolase-like amidase